MVVVVSAGCSGGWHRALPTPACRPSPAAGTSTTLTLQLTGPLPGARPQHVAGTVTVVATSTQRCNVAVGKSGEVSVELAPDTYHLTGTSPEYNDGSLLCAAAEPYVAPHGKQYSEGPPPQFVEINCPRR
jgi:hypothetical protein